MDNPNLRVIAAFQNPTNKQTHGGHKKSQGLEGSNHIYINHQTRTEYLTGDQNSEVAMENLQIVPACKNVQAQYVELRVPLYSYGCEKKIKKALSHFRGIYSVNVDFNLQKVTVWGICNKYDVLATIRSKRKEACFWDPEDSTEGNRMEESQKKPQSPSTRPLPPRRSISFTLSKARTLGWKLTLKKVFMRSDSF